MSYWYDADAGKASWISFDEKPGSWTLPVSEGSSRDRQVGILGSADGDAVLKASAPKVELPAPVVNIVEDSAAGERTLRFHVTSPRQARMLWGIVRKAAGVAFL
jgi:hypothetical protein